MTIIFGDTLQAFVDYESFTNCTGTPGLKALGRFLKMILSFYFFFYKFFFEYIFKMTLLEPSFVQTVIHPLNIDCFLSRLVISRRKTFIIFLYVFNNVRFRAIADMSKTSLEQNSANARFFSCEFHCIPSH